MYTSLICINLPKLNSINLKFLTCVNFVVEKGRRRRIRVKGKKYLWISFVLTLLVSMFMVNVPVNAAPKHDVAVTAVSAPPETAAGNLITINVDVANPGDFNETFNLTLSYDTNVTETREVSLNSSDSKTELFSWWTLNVTPTSYTIEAEAILATDEVPANNQKTTTILIQTPLATFSIDPNVTTGVPAGNPVSVNVTIDTNVKIVGFRLWIKIDPAVLSPGAYVEVFPGYWMWLYVTEGNFLSDWCADNNWTEGTVPISYTEETDGYSDISLFIKLWLQLPHGEGASGNGTLVTLWFTSQNETAYSRIDITQAQYTTTEDIFPVDVLNDGHYNEPVHDVAVTAVTAPAEATQGDTVTIDVDVSNLGDVTETFDVKVTYDTIPIETKSVELASNDSTTVSFNWDTTNVANDTYTINATAILVGDANPGNNWKTRTIVIELPTGGDVGVLNITLSCLRAGVPAWPQNNAIYTSWGKNISVTVVAKNFGGQSATFNVTAFYSNATGNYTIGTTTVPDLGSGLNETVVFSWDFSNLAVGIYSISAKATLDGDGNDISIYGDITNRLPGDANGNGKVNIADASMVGKGWQQESGDSYYDSEGYAADFNWNGKINIADAAFIGKNWQRETTAY